MSEIWSKMYIGPHVKYPLLISQFNDTLIFSIDFRKILKYKILWKSVQWVPSSSIRTDRQTWRCSQSLFAIFRAHLNPSYIGAAYGKHTPKSEGKSKLSLPKPKTKAYMGRRIIAPLIINPRSSWRRVVSTTIRPLYARKRLAVHQWLSRSTGEEKK